MDEHKEPYAHDVSTLSNYAEHQSRTHEVAVGHLSEAIDMIEPSAIIGVSAQYNAFNEEVVTKMCSLNKHPIIFALSNPTSKSECTAHDAYTWSKGHCIFASGSQCPHHVMEDGSVKVPGQGNNA